MLRFHGLDGMRKFYGEQSVVDFLSDATEFFKNNLRRLDVVARQGETGFGIILPATAHNVDLVRRRLLVKASQWMSGRFASGGGVTLEVATAASPANGKSVAKLLAHLTYKPADLELELPRAA
jgi:GGDEF domain-containing protein